MSLDRMLEMNCVFFALMKPAPRCSNEVWACNLSLGYV